MYHYKVREIITELLDKVTIVWLDFCVPIGICALYQGHNTFTPALEIYESEINHWVNYSR